MKISPLFYKPFFFAVGYSILFFILQFFFFHIGIFSHYPDAQSIMVWDTGFYQTIAQQGYNFENNSTGFYILFPLLWRLSQLGVLGIIVFNVIFFSVGFGLLMYTLKEQNKLFWVLCLTMPSIFFAFIPYTEALFFLLSSVLIYGIHFNKKALIWWSIFFLSLVRPTAVFLLPCLLFMEILAHPKDQLLKSIRISIVNYISAILLATIIFIVWQYWETGVWFAYFKTQQLHWDHHFSIPGFPLSNIENGQVRYHWLNALALNINIMALALIIFKAFKWL
jgi:hypothetical protein